MLPKSLSHKSFLAFPGILAFALVPQVGFSQDWYQIDGLLQKVHTITGAPSESANKSTVAPGSGTAIRLTTLQTPVTVDPATQEKRISNVFQDTDLKQALSDLGAAAGVPVVPDDTVQGNVTASVKNMTIEQALDVVLLPGGYSWTKIGNSYLVGKADPTSPNFLKFAQSRVYAPNFATADKIVAQLPTQMAGYVKGAVGDRSITITAAPSMMDRIMQDIKLLDRPPAKIVIEAMVTEANTDLLKQYDLSFTWSTFGMASDVNSPSLQFNYTQATAQDVGTLKALINKGLATIKASPRIMTLDGKEASIEVGQESYFEVVSGPVSFPYTTLQEIKTGISLKMTPFLSDDGQITVVLNPEVSDATGAGTNGLPIDTVRRASTTVRVRDGETIIIGGMTFESKRRSDTKIPIIGDLPLIGSLFRFYQNQTQKQDVIIMVTPRIIRDGDNTADVGKPLAKQPEPVTPQKGQ
jgi:type IV pilus assembly protein PilQ